MARKRSIAEIQKENEEIMGHDPSRDPHQLQMKRLASNTVESVTILHDEVVVLKQI